MDKIMHALLKTLLIMVAVLIAAYYFFGCDGEVSLGSGYRFFTENYFIVGPTHRQVGYKEDYIESIPPRILEYKYDRKFIIAKQNPNEASYLGSDFSQNTEHFTNFSTEWILTITG